MNTADRLIQLTSQEIRHRREMMSISQEDLGELCGLHRTYIGAIERGERNITLSTLLKIAEALGCELADLMPKRNKLGETGSE